MREITESIAYARCHGERGSEILSVTRKPPFALPPRRRGFTVSIPGEKVRQAFAAKLDARHRSS
jgi:hypothetical protein